MLAHGVKRLLRVAIFDAHAGHDDEALRLDVDLALFAFIGADLLAERVVRAQEPCPVPAMGEDGVLHRGLVTGDGLGLLRPAVEAAEGFVVRADAHEHAGDEQGFRHAAFKVRRGLETLARGTREAVEVQAVVPVRAADERQLVRAEVVQRIVEAAAQVLHERGGEGLIVVKRGHFGKDGGIARLLDVRRHAEDQPERVVVEAGTHVEVAALGQRLVLVVGAAVRKLGRGDVKDALPGALGNQVDKAEQVLRGVAEAHAAADAALVIAGGAGHVEGDHALVLVPQAHHAVKALLARVYLIGGQKLGPVVGQLDKRGVELGFGVKLLHERVGRGFVDHARGDELFLLRILAVAQHVHEAHALARGEHAL